MNNFLRDSRPSVTKKEGRRDPVAGLPLAGSVAECDNLTNSIAPWDAILNRNAAKVLILRNGNVAIVERHGVDADKNWQNKHRGKRSGHNDGPVLHAPSPTPG